MGKKRIVYYRDEQDEVMRFGLTELHEMLERMNSKDKEDGEMKQGDKVFYRDDKDDMTHFNFIKTKPVDKDFDYERKGVGNWLLRNVFVRFIVIPFFYFFRRIIIRTRFIGRKALRKHKGACFIYGNHTEVVPDAARAAIASFPHLSYIIVHPDNVSLPLLQPLMMALGCVPLPTNANGMKNFVHAIEKHSQKHPITIFPERVIWPYYTKIRNFSASSFHYPIKADKPVFTMTTTYHKGRLFKKPYKKVYIDGPFYPDHSLPPRERQKKLRDVAYETMCERAKLNTYEYYEYVQRDDAPEYRAKLALEEEMKKRKKKGRRAARAAELAPDDALKSVQESGLEKRENAPHDMQESGQEQPVESAAERSAQSGQIHSEGAPQGGRPGSSSPRQGEAPAQPKEERSE